MLLEQAEKGNALLIGANGASVPAILAALAGAARGLVLHGQAEAPAINLASTDEEAEDRRLLDASCLPRLCALVTKLKSMPGSETLWNQVPAADRLLLDGLLSPAN